MNIIFLGRKKWAVRAYNYLHLYGDVNHMGPIDLVVSFNYWKRIPQWLIDKSRLGVINFHPAPPYYKGRAGYNIAILNGDSVYGATAHYVIDETFDTGPIIKIRWFKIKGMTAVELERQTQMEMYLLFQEVLEKAVKGILPSFVNPQGLYLDKSQFEKMKEIKRGDDIDRKIKAFWFPPYRGAYVKLKGKCYTLVSDELCRLLPKLA